MKWMMLIILIIFLSGCKKNVQIRDVKDLVEYKEVIESTETMSKNYVQKEYVLYIEKEEDLSLYEPREGVYLGAYIQENENNYTIKEFEDIVQKSHMMYTHEMNLEDDFPLIFLLECIINDKIANIIINVNEYEDEDFKNEVQRLAKDFSKIKVPIFVQFMPLNKVYSANNYKERYEYAKKEFNKKADTVAFVWTINMEYVYEMLEYYPGDENVDWIGINLYYTQEEHRRDEMYNAIEYMYYTFQDKKPMMVSKLGVSHFNNIDYSYKIEDAREELNNIYKNIILNYPKIKSINYVDYNEIITKPDKEIKNNYKITENDEIIKEYLNIVSNKEFLTELSKEDKNRREIQKIKSPFPVYMYNNHLMMSEKSIIFNLGYKDLKNIQKIDIEGENYYKLDDVSKILNYDFTVEENYNKILLRLDV